MANSEEDQITLYGCPHACSLVSHIALEMSGLPFNVKWVNVFKREQFAPDYLAISPRGKIPLLVAPGTRILENTAILIWIAKQRPSARILPEPNESAFVEAVSNLSWFASGIHPQITRLIAPGRFTAMESCQESVRQTGRSNLEQEFALIDNRLSNREWWSEELSALDFYLLWIWARTGEGSLDQSAYAHYRRHTRQMLQLPAVKNVLRRERAYLDCFPDIDK